MINDFFILKVFGNINFVILLNHLDIQLKLLHLSLHALFTILLRDCISDNTETLVLMMKFFPVCLEPTDDFVALGERHFLDGVLLAGTVNLIVVLGLILLVVLLSLCQVRGCFSVTFFVDVIWHQTRWLEWRTVTTDRINKLWLAFFCTCFNNVDGILFDKVLGRC